MRVRIIDLDGAVTGQPQVPYWLQDMGGDDLATQVLQPIWHLRLSGHRAVEVDDADTHGRHRGATRRNNWSSSARAMSISP